MAFSFLCVIALLIACTESQEKQGFKEELLIRHLPDGRVLTQFQMTTTWGIHPLHLSRSRDPKPSVTDHHPVQHYGMFPKSLAEVVTHYGVQEMHLTLTRGKWRTNIWGYPSLSSPPGAEFWAWFLPTINDTSVDEQWKGLTHAVSGLMCASLSAIDPTSTYQPPRSFRPQGVMFGNVSSSHLRYAGLPREAVCTENLTPWKKLLPCRNKAGMASLLSALKLYNSHYHSLGLHWLPICKDKGCTTVGIEVRQIIVGVFNTVSHKQKTTWSLKSLFTGALKSACPLADTSLVYVDTSSNLPSAAKLSPPPQRIEEVTSHGVTVNVAVYDVHSMNGTLELSMNCPSFLFNVTSNPDPPLLRAQRHVTGSGHEWGGVHTSVVNDHTHPMTVVLLEMVPWYFRVMLHTMSVTCIAHDQRLCSNDDLMLERHYTPARDRQRPHTIQFLLSLPPLSTVSINYQFSRSFLKWNEYPPDAAHGFYVNSAVLTTVLDRCLNCTPVPASMRVPGWDTSDGVILQLHTEPLLISLPYPDFSMPYNVICFVSTVIAIGFGTLFNLTTKQLQPVPPAGSTSRKGLLTRILGRT